MLPFEALFYYFKDFQKDDVFREFLKSFDSPNDPDGQVRKQVVAIYCVNTM